jgi:ferric-dicitrate binding protein FerR (iron transport regulator)
METFRRRLSDGTDMALKAEGLRLAVKLQMARAFSRSDVENSLEIARERWRLLAPRLGMNPELNYYRALRADRALRAAARPRGVLLWRRLAMRVAAVLLPVALITGGYLLFDRMRGEEQTSTPYVATTSVTAHPDSVRYVTMPDGTQVILNRGAIFSYNDNREAELVGEAYFQVFKNPDHPFVIHSGHIKVTVLGTEFNFNTETVDGSSTLSLYEGRVQFDHASGTHVLEKGGREFSYHHATSKVTLRDFDATVEPEWLAYEKLYRFYSLAEIFRSIESTYGVTFEGVGSIDTTQRLSFRIREEASLEAIMSALKGASGDFDYKINEGIIHIQPKPKDN